MSPSTEPSSDETWQLFLAELRTEWAEEAQNPDWDRLLHVRSWRTYIADEIRDVWLTLPLDTRLLLIHVANMAEAASDYNQD